MDASLFIAKRLRFKGRIAMVCISVSFLVMIIAVSVSSGFRNEIRTSMSSVTGDVRLVPPTMNVLDAGYPIDRYPAYLPYIEKIQEIEDIVPTAYRAGIVKHGENIHGVIVKGMPKEHSSLPDSAKLAVSIPSRLAEMTGISIGDKMLTYFVGEEVKARQFNVVSIHETLVQTDDRLVVYADLSDIQRVNGWNENQISAMEITLDGSVTEDYIEMMTDEIGTMVNLYSSDDEATAIAVSSVSAYPQIFDWLNLIDFNVFFILVLMTIVAGFNMISGLLIMLFENVSTIGLLKSLGMTDKAIAKVFLSSSAALVMKGMAAGNLLAVLFCIVQGATHLLRLNPENYFVSFVPVNLDLGMIICADIVSFVLIMLFLLVPCVFISKVDPAETVRVR